MSAEFRLYDVLHGAPLRTMNGLHAELVGLRRMAVSGVYAPLGLRFRAFPLMQAVL